MRFMLNILTSRNGPYDRDPLTTKQLVTMALEVAKRFPDCNLQKNSVGNLAIIRDEKYIGFIDLRNGEVSVDGELRAWPKEE
jgi:hypothetical protein